MGSFLRRTVPCSVALPKGVQAVGDTTAYSGCVGGYPRHGMTAVASLLALLACSNGAARLPQDVPVTDSIIRIDAASVASLPVTTPSPDLQIGPSDAAPLITFGSVTGVAADSVGTIYILDEMSSAVRVFDSKGKHVRTIGRAGSGPGEFVGGQSLILKGDTVVVEGMGLHGFSSSGQHLWTHSNPTLHSASVVGQAGDALVFWLTEGREAIEGADDMTKAIYIWQPASLPDREPAAILRVVQRNHYYDSEFSWPVVLSSRVQVAASRSEGVYYTVGDSFHIAVMDATGVTRRVYLGKSERVETTAEDLEDFRRSILGGLARRKDPRKPPKFKGNGPVAVFRPAIGALIVSDDGRFMVKRTDLSERPYDELNTERLAEWQLFAVDGTPLIRIRLPGSVTIRQIVNCAIYASAEEAVGNPVVHRYSIPSESCFSR